MDGKKAFVVCYKGKKTKLMLMLLFNFLHTYQGFHEELSIRQIERLWG